MTNEKRKPGGSAVGHEQIAEKDISETYARYGRAFPDAAGVAAWRLDDVMWTFYNGAAGGQRRNVFFGYLLGNINKIVTDKPEVQTACIAENGDMHLGRRFMCGLSVDESRWVLGHELLHWCNRHFSRARKVLRDKYQVARTSDIDPFVRQVEHDLFNLAMDCSINQLLDGREDYGFARPLGKDFGVTLEGLEKQFKVRLEPLQEMEHYYWALCKSDDARQALAGAAEMAEKIRQAVRRACAGHDKGAQDGDGGEGKGGEELGDRMGDIQAEAVTGQAAEKQSVDDAVNGRSDNQFMSAIGKMLPKVDRKLKDRDIWKSMVFSNFGEVRSNDWRTSFIRPNRRDASNPRGRTPIRRSAHSVVVIDTSGSVLDDIPVFLGVVDRAAKAYGASCDILLCTTDVYAVHKGVKRPKAASLDLKTGGTDLTSAQRYIAENYNVRKTNVIVLTDGETPWDSWAFRTSVVYTRSHSKIPGIANFAVLSIGGRS